MAQGEIKSFSEYDFEAYTGDYDNSTDTFAYVFITNTFASIDENQSNPTLSSFTQVPAGGNYSGPTNLTNVTWVRTAGESRLTHDSITFAANPANPTTATCLLRYNVTSPNDDAIMVTDLTTDGTTPVNLTQGFTLTPNSNGVFTVTSNS